ncbi:uncharacterized protein LOC110821184 isoform X5 [Carica papaya]|uniref:uncharacterized protein LOC110821184 isoform X5 n=1 Tax=Carica papaya TaxID=3649 RepID=UPI000B8CB8B6|nr:uncharacterized protein LOC110821184 isoform X5 [Carica papaya]
MQGDEARVLLGFPPNSRPTLSQVKAAYKSKVWESHPDLFPAYEKPLADSKFKLHGLLQACTRIFALGKGIPVCQTGQFICSNSQIIQSCFPRCKWLKKWPHFGQQDMLTPDGNMV